MLCLLLSFASEAPMTATIMYTGLLYLITREFLGNYVIYLDQRAQVSDLAPCVNG